MYFDEHNEHEEDEILEVVDDKPKEFEAADDGLEDHEGGDDQKDDVKDGGCKLGGHGDAASDALTN